MLVGGSVLAASRCSASPPAPARGAVAALAVSGIAYGALAVAYPVASARYYGAAAHDRGVRADLHRWGVAGVTAPVAAGALFDPTGGYGTMLVILGVGSIARRGRERWRCRRPRRAAAARARPRGSRSPSCRRP